jgi:hypothetical protein
LYEGSRVHEEAVAMAKLRNRLSFLAACHNQFSITQSDTVGELSKGGERSQAQDALPM